MRENDMDDRRTLRDMLMSRRTMLRGATGLTFAAFLAACGGDDGGDDDAPDPTATSDNGNEVSTAANTPESGEEPTTTATATESVPTTATGASAAFPRTITHKYGETEVLAKPDRVVSVGYSEQDTLLALGVKPVGLRDWYGDQPFAVWPWAQDELGDAEPEIIGAGELDIEAIAALDPDIIVGVTSGMTEEEYDLLSQIAPTIPQPGEYIDYGTPWRVETRMIGEALGLSSEAEEVISNIEAQYAAIREEHPGFEGATTAVAFYFEEQPGAYASQDARSVILQELGFVIPDEFDELAGDSFFFSVSQEQIDVLDQDVIVWISSTEEGLDTLRELPTREFLTANAEGREVFLSPLLGGAFSFGSALSIEYLLENIVPMLAAAVDGDPETEVPS